MNNEEVRLECSPKLVKGQSEVNCVQPSLVSVSTSNLIALIMRTRHPGLEGSWCPVDEGRWEMSSLCSLPSLWEPST